MADKRIKSSSQTSPDLRAETRAITKQEKRHFQPEDATSNYMASKEQERVRPEMMAHFRASLEHNRRLGELLADA